jgi:hypothetical protein
MWSTCNRWRLASAGATVVGSRRGLRQTCGVNPAARRLARWSVSEAREGGFVMCARRLLAGIGWLCLFSCAEPETPREGRRVARERDGRRRRHGWCGEQRGDDGWGDDGRGDDGRGDDGRGDDGRGDDGRGDDGRGDDGRGERRAGRRRAGRRRAGPRPAARRRAGS